MNRNLSFLFPAIMIVGLVVSVFVIASSLQAASLFVAAPDPLQSAAHANASDLATQGRGLFLAKGCIVCHRRDDMAAARAGMIDFDFDDVPNLTKLKISADYLRRWLHDPKALKPATTMPNLNLSDGDIEALVAFLTSPNN
jgi:cytochrome c1